MPEAGLEIGPQISSKGEATLRAGSHDLGPSRTVLTARLGHSAPRHSGSANRLLLLSLFLGGCRKVFGVYPALSLRAAYAPPNRRWPMILSAITEKLKRRSKDDFKGRHFE